MINDNIIKELELPGRYHYKDLWRSSQDSDEEVLLEIFAFGTVKDLPKELQLTHSLTEKLRKLTIISLSQDHRDLSYDFISQECQINKVEDVERYLIELNSLIEVKMDSTKGLCKILKWKDCRDVYCGEKPLHVVKRVGLTKNDLILSLEQWKEKLQVDILD